MLAGDEVEMMSLINSGKVMGQSMLQFLRSAGRPELALSFIKDPMSRFCLALEPNNITAAMDAAKILDTAEAWDRLGLLCKKFFVEKSNQKKLHISSLMTKKCKKNICQSTRGLST